MGINKDESGTMRIEKDLSVFALIVVIAVSLWYTRMTILNSIFFISIQIKTIFIETRRWKRNECERQGRWWWSMRGEEATKKVKSKIRGYRKRSQLFGLLESDRGSRRIRLRKRLSEGVVSASRFFGAFFLSQVWCKYRSKIFFFSVIMTERRRRSLIKSLIGSYCVTYSAQLVYQLLVNTRRLVSWMMFAHCHKEQSFENCELGDL